MMLNRRRTASKNRVVAGSVWESRIKIDEGKGGIKVFNGGENPEEDQASNFPDNQTELVVRNRKTWKSKIEGDPIQLSMAQSNLLVRMADDFYEKKMFGNVGQIKSKRTALSKDDEDDEDKNEEMEMEKESIDIKEVNPAEEKQRTIEEKEKIHEIPISPCVEKKKIHEQAISPFKQRSVSEKEKIRQVEEKLRLIHEKSSSPFKHRNVAEKERFQKNHEIHVSPFKHRSVEEKEKLHQIHEMPISPIKQRSVAEYGEKQRSLAEKQKIYQFHEIPTSENMEKRPPPTIDHPSVDPDLTRAPPVDESFENMQESRNRLQSVVDLVMWRDISKSAFVFGLGTFIILSSFFTKDLNFSFISAISYLGLFYLAAIFFYKSILHRGAIDLDEGSKKYMIGEEEAIWVLKLILPYFNELPIKIRVFFSGDPATTMKLATLLFVLARCGNSITIWTMIKLAFFGVFTLPKFCSAYSKQITRYGKFWVQCLGDAWDSCTHKKAVAAAIFTVTWNSSSITARIWAVFMLIVAVQFYQQSTGEEEDSNRQRQKKGGPTQMESRKDKEKKGY